MAQIPDSQSARASGPIVAHCPYTGGTLKLHPEEYQKMPFGVSQPDAEVKKASPDKTLSELAAEAEAAQQQTPTDSPQKSVPASKTAEEK
jgi:hypothetical protein